MEFFPLLKYSLLEDFSVEARWTQLNSNEESDYKFGTLKYINGEAQLFLFQGWHQNLRAITSNMPLFRKSNILGDIANDNYRYIFIPEISIDQGYNMPLTDVTYKKWYVNQFSVLDFNPKDLSSKIFNKVIVNFTMLDRWISPALRFMRQFGTLKTDVKTSKPIELAHFTYKGQLFEVYLIGNVNMKHGENDRFVNYKNSTWILIEGENEISTDLAIFFATELRKMFSVILGKPLNTMQLSRKGFDRESQREISEDVYFEEMRYDRKKEELLIYDTFQEKLDIQLDNLVPNWLSKGDNLDLLIQDYLLTLSFTQTVQNKLINLTEGIEAYYRDKRQSLCQKIKSMIHSFPLTIQQTLEKCVGDLDFWILSLKQTRVYIAHGEKKSHMITDLIELSQSVNALQYLVQYFILQELGMNIHNSENVEYNLIHFFESQKI